MVQGPRLMRWQWKLICACVLAWGTMHGLHLMAVLPAVWYDANTKECLAVEPGHGDCENIPTRHRRILIEQVPVWNTCVCDANPYTARLIRFEPRFKFADS